MPRFNYRQTDPTPNSQPSLVADRPEIPYLLPLFVFLLVMVPGSFGHIAGVDWQNLWKNYLPLLYALKSAAAAVLLWYFWPCYTRVRWNKWWLGLLTGIIGTFLWIGTELAARKIGLAAPPATADIYNPDAMLGSKPWLETLHLCLRVAGPTLVVPFMEELFFRDFIMRILIKRDNFQEVPVGTFSWLSLLGMSALFGINHGQMFLAGFAYGLLMGILLIRTKSLGACIIAHGTTNLTLYLWVIHTGQWGWM